jgi:TonB-dependent receptor
MSIGSSRIRNSIVCIILAAVFSLTFQSLYAAGSGTIKGHVFDKVTSDPLIGANVVVLNTSLGASANIDGLVTIYGVPSGPQTLKISYIGYQPVVVQVTIPDDGVLDQEFRLTPQAIEGKEVVVTAQAKGQQEAINQQLSSNKIVNVVSSEKMKELPDANIAESIGRLPGVSLGRTAGEADKVVVRGLSAQFNKVTIEGVPMVSMSGGRASGNTNTGSSNYSDRSIDLSMISDDLVKGVELSKSLRADMDADAIGGTINLTLREAPSDFHYDIQANGGFNDLIKYWKNYKVAGSVSDRFLNDAIGVRLQLNAEDKALPSQQFNAGYDGVSSVSSLVNGQSVYSLTRKTNNARLTVDDLDRKRYGGSLMLDYKSDFVDIIFFNIYNQKKDHDEQYNTSINFQATGDGLFTVLDNISDFKTEERTHSLQTKFKFLGTELDASFSYTKGNYSNPGYDFPFIQVKTPSLPGANIYVYADPASLINLAGADNPANMYLRNLDKTNNFLNDNTTDAKLDYHIPFRVSDEFSGKLSLGGKYHKFNRVNDGTSIYYNMEWGGSSQRADLFMAWLTTIDPNAPNNPRVERGVSGMNFMDKSYTPPSFLNGRYQLDNWGYNLGYMNWIGQNFYTDHAVQYWVDGPQSFNSDFDEAEKLAAGYVMPELNIGSDLTVVPGIRWEQLQSAYGAYAVYTNNSMQNGLQGKAPIWRVISTTHVNFFPSVNIKYKATENIQLMGAYYASAARPNFSDLSPLVDYPSTGNVNASSNPYLKPAIAQNYDLGVSLSSNTLGLITINGFYKEISDLVYSMPFYMPARRADIVQAPADMLNRLPGFEYFDSTFFAAATNKSLTTNIPINNPEKAFIRGLEFSWQTNFWYLPGMLSGLVLDVNASVMSSRTFYPYFDGNTVKKDSLVRASGTTYTYYQAYRTRPGAVVNMPKATYNVIVGWDYLGFSSRVSFRYQQTTLTSLDSKFSIADAYYDNVLLTDIMVKQKIFGNLSVFANFTNIGSHIDDYYYHAPINLNLATSQQTYGFNAQFGFNYYL